MSLADQRREYGTRSLERGHIAENPFSEFAKWYEDASRPGRGRFRRFGIALYKAFQELLGKPPLDPNAMVIASVNGEGQPSTRTVLLKSFSNRGFTFFTNYESRKGRELEANPHAALTFYWPELERQVCVTGSVTRVSREESEAYFQSRPRASQIGAWASQQSRVISSRSELQQAEKQIEQTYAGRTIPLPPFWGGYLLTPSRIEFWQGRASRLHDRFEFTRGPADSWALNRLSP